MAVALALAAVILVVAPERAEAAVRACATDSQYRDLRRHSNDCINGTRLSSRGYLSENGCYIPAQSPIVTADVCTSKFGMVDPADAALVTQFERIAQARAIRRLDEMQGSDGLDSVNPAVQWETRSGQITKAEQGSYGANLATGRGRIDILNYTPGSGDPATNPVELWEVKGTWTPGVSLGSFASVVNQVGAYASSFNRDYGWAAMPGTSLLGWTDAFVVKDLVQCKDGSRRDVRYDISVPAPGVILVDPKTPRCDRDEKENEEAGAEEDAEAADSLRDALDNDASDDDSSDSSSNRTESHVEKWVIGGVATTVVVAGSVALWQYFKNNVLPVCVELGQTYKGPSLTSPGPVTDGCLACALAAEEAVAAGASESAAWDLALAELGTMVDAGYITVETLAAVFGISVVAAAALVATSRARASGDPHLITLDGLNYDLQSVGEFVLASVPDAGVTVQARFTATTTNLSVVNSLAFELDGSVVELGPDGSVRIDGTWITLQADSGYTFDDGSYLVKTGGNILVQWPGTDEGHGVALTWQPNGGIGFVGLSVPPSLSGRVSGLLGNFDGDPKNDLKLRDGTQLASTVSAAYLHDGYADSWRIANSESYFTYADGKDTESYTNKAFPSSIITRGDFTEQQRAEAMAICQAYGVAAGPSFDDCELDVLATGNWAFASSAAKVRVPSIVAGDAEIDSDGRVAVDFEGDIPNNFGALRVGEDAAVSTFAGPFSGTEQFRFYVPLLPGHDSAFVSFDLLSFGSWDATDTVKLRIDDGTVTMPLDWSQAEVGQLENGSTVRKLHLEIPVAHHLPLLAGTLTGTGLSSAAGQGFGVDNVSVNLRLVPAQEFPHELARGVLSPLDSRSGMAGAGLLENRGAVDRYRLDIPAGEDLYLDWATSSSSLGWRARDEDGTVIKSGVARDGDTTIQDVPGPVTVDVYALGANPPQVQQYSLSALWVPEVDAFDLGVIGAPVTVSNGQPGPGAGNLETKASMDEYSFTVPAGGSRVVIDRLSGNYGSWQVLDSDDQAHGSGTFTTTAGRRFDAQLDAGTYRLQITSQSEQTGTYSLRFYGPQPDQTFDLGALSDTTLSAVTNGKPATGAGNLETWLSRDVYEFTTTGGDVLLDVVTGSTALLWQVLDSHDQVVGSAKLVNDTRLSALDADTYRLSVWIDPNATTQNATYALNLLGVPEVDAFDLGVIGAPVTVSNGQPGPGAGNLETKASMDEYSFTVPAGGSRVVIDRLSGNYGSWQVLDSDDQAHGSGTFTTTAGRRFDAQLDAGTYRLQITSQSEQTGTYSLRFSTSSP